MIQYTTCSNMVKKARIGNEKAKMRKGSAKYAQDPYLPIRLLFTNLYAAI